MRHAAIIALLLAPVALLASGCGGGDDQKDAATDPLPEQTTDTADVQAEETAPAEEAIETPTDAPAEETTAPACGNGTVDSGEKCDDGNQTTEFCSTSSGTACLGDCSLLESTCGNSTSNPGEQCDDGDTDSMDDCTTSCTTNDHNIGAPCTCTGGGCKDTDFTAGTINGCGSVPSVTGGVLACIRSMREATTGTESYFAEGYCTVMALKCDGPTYICNMVPQTGNIDSFSCPSGYFVHTDSRTVLSLATITTKTCLKGCTSPSQCRWNANDAFRTACGQYDCVTLSDISGSRVCYDLRNAVH